MTIDYENKSEWKQILNQKEGIYSAKREEFFNKVRRYRFSSVDSQYITEDELMEDILQLGLIKSDILKIRGIILDDTAKTISSDKFFDFRYD